MTVKLAIYKDFLLKSWGHQIHFQKIISGIFSFFFFLTKNSQIYFMFSISSDFLLDDSTIPLWCRIPTLHFFVGKL